MTMTLPFPPIVLTFVMIFLAVAALWWLLRSESWRTLALVGALTVIGLALRLYQIEQLPPGLNDDEIKTLRFAAEVVGERRIFRPILNVPMFWTALLYFPFLSLSGSVLWTMRLVPVLLGTLAIPASFSVGRALSFGIGASFVGAACVATMPWAIFWSRQHWASGIVFFEALLLAALARIVWCRGGWIEVAIATFGLAGVLYDYTGGWVMAGMPLLAALLASSMRQRIQCALVFIASMLLWIPWLLQSEAWLHIVSSKSIEDGSSLLSWTFVQSFIAATTKTLRTFIYPEGAIYWTSLQGVAMHPVLVLGAAALGLVCCLFRKAFFLGLGFFAGMIPAIMSSGVAASGHRMIACYLFIALATGALFESLWRLRSSRSYQAAIGVVATVFMVVASVQSIRIFLSPDFWKGSDGVFWYGATKLSETIELPVTKPVLVDFELARFLEARSITNPGYTVLSHENWMPTAPIEHNITPPLSFVLPLYAQALPESHITVYGSGATMAFRARFDERHIAEWRSFGWTVEAMCGEQRVAQTQIPAVVFGSSVQWSWRCQAPQTMIYRGVWIGAPTSLTLVAIGAFNVRVETSSGVKAHRSPDTATYLNFDVSPRDEITIVANLQNGLQMRLLEGRDGVGAIVPLKSVQPLSGR